LGTTTTKNVIDSYVQDKTRLAVTCQKNLMDSCLRWQYIYQMVLNPWQSVLGCCLINNLF